MDEVFVSAFADELEKIALTMPGAKPGFMGAMQGIGRAFKRGGVGGGFKKTWKHIKHTPSVRRAAIGAGIAGAGLGGVALGRAGGGGSQE